MALGSRSSLVKPRPVDGPCCQHTVLSTTLRSCGTGPAGNGTAHTRVALCSQSLRGQLAGPAAWWRALACCSPAPQTLSVSLLLWALGSDLSAADPLPSPSQRARVRVCVYSQWQLKHQLPCTSYRPLSHVPAMMLTQLQVRALCHFPDP